jgi:imidazolonepropionase-like amidohydrolase
VATSTLIRGGVVIDGAGNNPGQADVLIEEGRILKIGQNLPSPNDASIMNADGMTVMPGLIDAHCHVTFDEPSSNDELFFHRRESLAALIAAQNAGKVLRAGVTSFLDADCIFDIGVDLRDAIEAGIVEGPRMSTGGNALLTSVGGTAGNLIPNEGRRGYAQIVRTPDEIVGEVRRQIKLGVDWIKVHVTGLVPRQRDKGEIQAWSFDEMRLVCDTAHALGIPVVGHCRGANSIKDAARAGMDMILHATFMDDEALEALVDAKCSVVPTFTFQANLADYGEAIGADPDLQRAFRDEISGSADMLHKAHKAGVPILCGTESGFSLTPYGEWHYREMEVFVEYLGFTPLEAIKAGTSEGARIFNKQGELGIVAENAIADLIIIDGDPVKDIGVLGDKTKLKHVLLGGRAIDLDRELPPRGPIPGWRVSEYSHQILTQETARVRRKAP